MAELKTKQNDQSVEDFLQLLQVKGYYIFTVADIERGAGQSRDGP